MYRSIGTLERKGGVHRGYSASSGVMNKESSNLGEMRVFEINDGILSHVNSKVHYTPYTRSARIWVWVSSRQMAGSIYIVLCRADIPPCLGPF